MIAFMKTCICVKTCSVGGLVHFSCLGRLLSVYDGSKIERVGTQTNSQVQWAIFEPSDTCVAGGVRM